MPTLRDNAIVIRRWDFSETSQTVSLFTREHGIIRGLAKGAKREKAPFSGGLDLLTRGQIVALTKPGRELATLTAWSLEEIFPQLRDNLDANRAGFYMADLVHHLLTAHDPSPVSFDAFITALRRVGYAHHPEHSASKVGTDHHPAIPLALLHFQWILLTEAGYKPILDHNARSGKPLPENPSALCFDPQAGGVTLAAGDNPRDQSWRVRLETIRLLRDCVDQNRDGSGEDEQPPAADPETITRANKLLAAYIREILGHEPPTLRWIFPELRRG